MEHVSFEFKEEAQKVLTALQELISKYEFVTVGDYYTLVGLPTTYLHNKSGWSFLNETNTHILQDDNGRWYLDLPGPGKTEPPALQSAMANLGMATTEDLFRELITRLAIVPVGTPTILGNIISTKRGLILAEMLGSLDTMEREYRTVNG